MTIVRFTPSLLDGETLDRLFVHRHDLLDDAVSRIEAASRGDERRHRLFVGPRGAGKTHLISLIHHRAMTAGLPVRLSWLTEDPWEIETYDDLLDQIVENLDVDADGLTSEAAILKAAPVVVLLENLDQILAAIGQTGQRKLRALLENERPLLIIATSTRLSDDLLSQAEPFYGFFDTVELQPFDVEQARDMLARIADVTGNDALGSVMTAPEAPARLATIAQLAGGQPRIWTLLGTGLTSAGIDDMVAMLISRFDDLTPYYQEQLARLSPNERKAVRRLADADRPLTVRDLAGAMGVDQKSVAKTISDLRKRGWVRKYKSILTQHLDARLSYYELAEPLARIAFQVKAARGAPIKLVIDFLAIWFDAAELDALSPEEAMVATYLTAARHAHGSIFEVSKLLAMPDQPSIETMRARAAELLPIFEELDDALAASAMSDHSRLLNLPASVAETIAHRLARSTPGRMRFELAELAYVFGFGPVWRVRLDDLIASAEPDVRRAAIMTLIKSEWIGQRDEPATRALIATLSDEVKTLDKKALDTFVRDLLKCLGHPSSRRAVALLTRVVDDEELNDQLAVELAFYASIGDIEEGEPSAAVARMHRACQRVAANPDLTELLGIEARFFLALILIETGRRDEAVSELTALHADIAASKMARTAVAFLLRFVLTSLEGSASDRAALVADARSALGDQNRAVRFIAHFSRPNGKDTGR